MGLNKRETGEKYEGVACEYLEREGFRVVERNFRCRQGEVDVVGWHEGYLVFVEVKYRAAGSKGAAAEAVTYAKQKRICRVADYYRYKHGIGEDKPVRYDVVAIEGKDDVSVVWYKNAFWHIYAGRK